jgi:glutamyl-tRNA synthetase
MSQIRVRFAPSPTGDLHIGGARTALFNFLYARHTGGQFFLRIEDTDRARSTEAAVNAILDGLHWLGLHWDGEPVFQFARAARHQQVAYDLLAAGKAYKCFTTPAELEAMRAEARAAGRPPVYNRSWRDRTDHPTDQPFVIRIKMPITGETVIDDAVQGTVRVDNRQLDDFVLLRADQTPTYMLSVVVDDHDMGITHIIRGDDHLNNAFRQRHLYAACGWDVPVFAHIPLIHGADGAKLSKRHGAVGVTWYRDAGFLPEALRNYLLRLGWSHGDAEIISDAEAAAWFDLDGLNKAAARFDLAKLTMLNAHYLRQLATEPLQALLQPFLSARYGTLTPRQQGWLTAGLPSLRERARTLVELADAARIYLAPLPLPLSDAAQQQWTPAAAAILLQMRTHLASWTGPWDEADLLAGAKMLAETTGIKLGALAAPVRIALTGDTASPSVFEILGILGREESLRRIDALCATGHASHAQQR